MKSKSVCFLFFNVKCEPSVGGFTDTGMKCENVIKSRQHVHNKYCFILYFTSKTPMFFSFDRKLIFN